MENEKDRVRERWIRFLVSELMRRAQNTAQTGRVLQTLAGNLRCQKTELWRLRWSRYLLTVNWLHLVKNSYLHVHQEKCAGNTLLLRSVVLRSEV